MERINLAEKFDLIDEHWSPRVIAELNDYQFKLAKIRGEFTWHRHEDTDEAFLVIEGTMCIDFRDRSIDLAEGELCVVPKGVEHRPRAATECRVMIIEPRGVVNTGNERNDLTAETDVWI